MTDTVFYVIRCAHNHPLYDRMKVEEAEGRGYGFILPTIDPEKHKEIEVWYPSPVSMGKMKLLIEEAIL